MVPKEPSGSRIPNPTPVENVMGAQEARPPFHAEDETLPGATSSLWKRKGSSHLSA